MGHWIRSLAGHPTCEVGRAAFDSHVWPDGLDEIPESPTPHQFDSLKIEPHLPAPVPGFGNCLAKGCKLPIA